MEQKDKIVIDLREVFGILKCKIVKVLIVTILFLIAAGCYIYITPNKYESRVIIKVPQHYDEYFKAHEVMQCSSELLRIQGINYSVDQISSKIKFIRTRNSRFLSVTALDLSPELACKVVEIVGVSGVQYVISNVKETFDEKIVVYQKAIRNRNYPQSLNVVYADMVKLEAEKEALGSKIKIIENASINPTPVAPRKMRIMAVAMVLGLICGSMYVVLKEKL